jgi:hypothetical protein
MTLSLAKNVKNAAESEGDATDLTPVNVNVTLRTSMPSSGKFSSRKKAITTG